MTTQTPADLAATYDGGADAFARSVANMQALAAVLPRLEAAPAAVAELVTLAPELVCELGFDGAMISRVADGAWRPEAMYIVGNPKWAEQIAAAGQVAPLTLDDGGPETVLVQDRVPILVRDAQRSLPWNPRSMLAVSKVRAYVAAPLASGAEVVGILHAAFYRSGRCVDELDRDLLAAFAEALQLALTRAALAEKLHSAEQALAGMSASFGAARADVHRMPAIAAERAAVDEPGSFIVRSRPPDSHPLPATLTPRELEVLELMAGGRTNLAIAQALHISEGTVKQHVKHVLRKLRVTNRSEAVVRWFKAGGSA